MHRAFLVVTALGALTACGRAGAPDPEAPAPAEISRTLPADQLLALEVAGVAPGDTSVTWPAALERRIILRHGPPDNTVFVELEFPAGTFPANGTLDSVTVTVQPIPGLYGFRVETSLPPAAGGRVRFKYPVHFGATAAGLARYGTRARYERALLVLVQLDSLSWGVLPSTRPAADNLEAPLRGAGRYLVAAPA
ncbi:MAG: hypothetical protein SF070_05675 [Gemmatimonadota bacterium]|nr:hypothetical protein [Gemmatimonadota bacterium]